MTTYRDVRRAHAALAEISLVRDGGIKDSESGRSYVGKPVLPTKAAFKVRRLLRELEPLEKDATDHLRELHEELAEPDGTINPADIADYQRRQREVLDTVVEDYEVKFRIKASDFEKRIAHFDPLTLVGLGPWFEDEEPREDGE